MFRLDTGLCVYLVNESDAALKDKFDANAADICISSITYAELCFGVARSTRVERNGRERGGGDDEHSRPQGGKRDDGNPVGAAVTIARAHDHTKRLQFTHGAEVDAVAHFQ